MKNQSLERSARMTEIADWICHDHSDSFTPVTCFMATSGARLTTIQRALLEELMRPGNGKIETKRMFYVLRTPDPFENDGGDE